MRALLLCILFLPIEICAAVPRNISNKALFKLIYDKNYWVNNNTRSGNGSDLAETPILRRQLPVLLQKYDVKVLLDVGCGEMFWQKEINLDFLELYMGVDIVDDIIEHNRTKYGNEKRTFAVLDIVQEVVPTVDLIMCRDVLQHLMDKDAHQAIMNIKASKSKYLLTSTFRNKKVNENPADISNPVQARITGRGRNLQLPPFNFPEPIDYIIEGFEGKTMALWLIKDLPDYQIIDESHQARVNLLED